MDAWISATERRVQDAARVEVPTDGVAFELVAPSSREAGVALIESMRRILRIGRRASFINWFGDRLPEDIADYVHAGATYAM
jgi:hypothetical protein